jgi:hypothetical protein
MSDPIESFDESILKTFHVTFESLDEQGILTPIITLARLKALLSTGQQSVVDQIMGLNP